MKSSPTIRALLLATGCCAAQPLVARTHDVIGYGAVPDGRTLCTAAIQKAIDTAAADGGGTVRLPSGAFLTGALELKSGVTLELGEGATLLGSRDLKDYHVAAPGGEPVFRNLIHGTDVHDIAIRGQGTIDGNGDAFRDKTKPRPRNIYLERCRNVVVEGVRLRSSGSWMQHYRRCENVILRDLDVYNHVAFNNDGLDIDSCQNVTIARCRVDSDDDAIVLKSLSTEPCRNVTITDCTISSHCNGLKMGTESGGGFLDITIANCVVSSPKTSKATYGKDRGLAGIALEIVDGGRMENVTVSDVTIEGVTAPLFLRLGNRGRLFDRKVKPPVGTLRQVRLRNITARGVSPVGCSITGLPGHPIEEVSLENIDLSFDGRGTVADAARAIPERPEAYPECTMYGTLPAYGLFCRHVRGLRLRNVKLRTTTADLRHALMFDDAQDVALSRLDATDWPGGAPLLRIDGAATRGIVLSESELPGVRQLVALSPGVPSDAFRH